MMNVAAYSRRDFALSDNAIKIILSILFFCSGISALIYQLMWQRMLFTIFGVDLLSITVIVSVFMFGLGVGGIVGGIIADKLPAHLLRLYICIELGIAVFGLVSPWLIITIGNIFFSNNEFATMASSFIILAIPTILMGATFPILVKHVNVINQNIGRSVGNLYFANTLGGAFGAYLAGFVLLSSMDMTGAIDRAALLNIAIAFSAYLVFRRK